MSDRKDFQIKKTHSKALKLAMLSEAESVRFGTCRAMWHSHWKSQKVASMCCSFLFLPFVSSRLAELFLWLDKPLINPSLLLGSGNVTGNSFVFRFDVSIVISHGQCHCGKRGY